MCQAVILLPLHATILEPDLDLSLGQTELVCHLDAPAAGKVAVIVELLLEFQSLVPRVAGARSLSVDAIRPICAQTPSTTVSDKKSQLSLTNPRDAVKIRVMGHQSPKGIEISDTISIACLWLYRPIYSNFVKCTVFEIWRHIGRKLPEKNYLTLIWHVLLGMTPCDFFDDSYTLPENEIMGAIRWCTFHDPAFALLDTIPAVTDMDRRTDGHVAAAALCR